MRSSQLNRDQKKMGMVGTTRRFWLLAPPKPLIELSPLSRKKTNPPSNCASWARAPSARLESANRKVALYNIRILGQPGLRQPFDDALEVGRILVGQDTGTLGQREIGIDLEQRCPCGARFLSAAEMTVSGGQQHATGIGVGIAVDAV